MLSWVEHEKKFIISGRKTYFPHVLSKELLGGMDANYFHMCWLKNALGSGERMNFKGRELCQNCFVSLLERVYS